jgi:prepilin-type N-terminal cleavage/methylation domain-containing protein
MKMRECPLHKCSREQGSREQGFTLIEIALALGILSVMVLLNYNMITTLVESKMEIDDQRDSVFVANSVLSRLTRELQLASSNPKLVPPCENASSDPTARLPAALLSENGSQGSGKGQSLIFSSRSAAQYIHNGKSHSGPVQISYLVEQDPDQKGGDTPGLLLIRDEIPNRPPFDAACKDVIRFPITNRLVTISYKFFDKTSNEWSDTWEGTKASKLPNIIQFTMMLKSDKGRVTSYTTAVNLTP